MKTKTNLLVAGMLLAAVGNAVGQPIITNQPQNQTNIAGTTATFIVGTTGAEPLSYQWRSYVAAGTTFTNIPFGTEATLVLTNVQPTTRLFAVEVTDSGGSATSSPLASLTVLVPPGITNQPASRTVGRCATVTFSVSASGTAPLRYQWRWNEMDLARKTNSTLVLTNVQTTNAGGYVVVVTNSAGSITSQVATLTVDPRLIGYNALYVFGSSWADTRNGPYWQGHYSNGPMWPEFLSTNFGLAYIPANNFAVGGSLTDVVLSQAANFSPPANPELCLYHFWAGYTDFLRNPDSFSSDVVWQSRIGSWVGNISNAVVRLYGKGARSIAVPNSFDRSREPWFITLFGSNSANQLLFRQRISEFNAALAGALENIDRARPDLRLYTLNMQSKWDELHTNATTYGFTKTFPSALDDPSLTDKSFTGPGRNYLYWDDHHATSKGHEFMAAWNLEAITNSVLERLTISTAGNAFTLRMNKLQICRDYTLQRSSDLTSWQDVHAFTASAGTNEWVVPVSEMSPAFFRLKWIR